MIVSALRPLVSQNWCFDFLLKMLLGFYLIGGNLFLYRLDTAKTLVAISTFDSKRYIDACTVLFSLKQLCKDNIVTKTHIPFVIYTQRGESFCTSVVRQRILLTAGLGLQLATMSYRTYVNLAKPRILRRIVRMPTSIHCMGLHWRC